MRKHGAAGALLKSLAFVRILAVMTVMALIGISSLGSVKNLVATSLRAVAGVRSRAFTYVRIVGVASALLLMGGLTAAMTVLSADRNTISKASELQGYPAGVDIFYKGAMVCINASGFVVPAADTAGYSAVIGVVEKQIDNSGGSAGDLTVQVRSNRRFQFVATGTLVQGNVGETMYVVDDQTFDADQQVNAIVAGVLTEFVSTTAGYVSIEMPAGSAGDGVTTTELALQGRNESGSSFEPGDICVVDHYDETEDRMVLVLADADTIGLAAVHLWTTRVTLATATNGTFHKTYRETGQNTATTTEGDAVWLSTTPGDWTITTPQNADPNGVAVSVGRVAVVDASTGEVEINLSVGGLEQIGTNEIQDSGVTAAKIAAAAVTQAKMEEGSIVFVDVQLTNANVLALATGVGIQIVAAPAADKALVFKGIHIVSDAAAGAWTEPSAPDDLVVQYADGVDVSGAIEAGALVAASVNVREYGPTLTEVVPDVAAALHLFNTGSNWGGGDAANTMSLRVWYSVVDTIAFS